MPKRSTVRLTKRIVDAAEPNTFVWDSEVPGFGLRVTANGAKSFIVQYRTVTGKQGRYAFARYPTSTVEQARDVAREKLRGVRDGGDPSKDRQKLRDAPTLDDLAEHYLVTYAEERALRTRTIKDARVVLKPFRETHGQTKVTDITTTDIRKAHGVTKKLSGRYQANRMLAALSKMFSLAIELGWRSDHPCKGVKKYPEEQRWRNLGHDEVARLLEACDAYENQNAADAIRLLLFTGARLREALKAEWSEFDLEGGFWEKPSAHTKTKRQHRLELAGPGLELLKDMRERDPEGRFLFPGIPIADAKGELVERYRADLKRPWAWVTKHAQLEGVRLHDLRRTTASFMLSSDASLATVGKALGHTQASTTARYAQLAQGIQGKALGEAGKTMAALKGTSKRGNVIPFNGRDAK